MNTGDHLTRQKPWMEMASAGNCVLQICFAICAVAVVAFAVVVYP
ncbi:MAG: hypothetical protein ACOCM4_02735 [Acetivibrio ethanolgignens]